MANSIKEYKYNAGIGSSSPTYTAPDYLDGRALTDIQVWVGDEHHMISRLVQDTDYSIVGTQVTIDGYSLSDQEYVYIKRVSNPDARLTDYVDGSLLTADTLDADANQIFYLTQEASDEASKTNMAAGAFYYAGETAPTREVNNETIPPPVGTLWYDMTSSPNVLRIWDGTEWYYATPLKVTLKFTNTSDEYTSNVHLGTNIDFIQTTQYTSKSDVYLNGVKLSLASSVGTIDTDGDYFYNTTTNNLSLLALGADDVITIETFVGGYSTEISEKEASMTALFDVFNAKYTDVTPKLDEVIALDIPTKMLTMSGYVLAAGTYMENARDYAISDVPFINEVGVIAESAKTYAAEAQTEADRAYEIANGTQDKLEGWTAIDNETITTTSTTDPILYSKTKLTLKSDDKVLIDSPLKINGPLEISGATDLTSLGVFNPIAVGRAFVDTDGDMHEVWEGSSNVTVNYHTSGTVKISHPDFESDKMAIFAHFVPDTRSGGVLDEKPYAVKVEPQADNSIRLQASRDGGTQQLTNYSISSGSIAVVVYKF